MAEADTIAGRLKQARFQTAARLREPVSGERMAELLGEALGRTMHATQYRRYESGTEPPLDVIRAVARLSGLAEAYIAFGTTISSAVVDPTQDRRLTEDELDRADRAAAKTTSRKASARKRGNRGR